MAEFTRWCDQCEPLMINGIFCHETGCPNINKIWDSLTETWIPEGEEYDCDLDLDDDTGVYYDETLGEYVEKEYNDEDELDDYTNDIADYYNERDSIGINDLTERD